MDSSESKSKMIRSKPQDEQSEFYSDIENLFIDANLRKFYEGYQESQVSFTNVVDTNETSLERIERKIDELRKEVATKEDIIKQTQALLDHQKSNNKELLNKLEILRSLQISNVPHKRLARISFAFFSFFAISFLSYIVFDIVIVTPFWTNIGLLFSFLFLLMSLAMKIDWSELIKKKD